MSCNALNDGYVSSRSSSPEADWVNETVNKMKAEDRKQPWKATFGGGADTNFDENAEDLLTVGPAKGGKCDPNCPFKTQGSSLAA